MSGIQFAHTWEQVLEGCKIESRRPWKGSYSITKSGNVTTLWDGKRVKLRTGQVRAMQPGRGKPAIARIRIEAIWLDEDVRQMDQQTAEREGFDSPGAFIALWQQMHTRPARLGGGCDYRAYAFRFSLVKTAPQPIPLPQPEQLRLMG